MEYIDLKTGESHILALQEIGAAGYLWSVLHEDVLIITKTYAFREDQSVGGPTRVLFDISSKIPGRYKLVLTHLRPWNGEVYEIKEFIYNITE